ncbi:hypothetical protein JD77_02886 [Micromonospora olivasterospora]|uniref:Uncharacterized protein n=1 Tax=Micromonospora olivasterospora TaxID=1880 RepID=A0A562IAA2_MICOL|nr:hypothetical protein JD77_02886 [Micromonospora olivasterospora]
MGDGLGAPSAGASRPGTAELARALATVSACSSRARTPMVRPGSRTSPRDSWETNQAGRYPSIGRPGFTASHHSWFGQSAARSAYALRRLAAELSPRQARRAADEVNAKTWVRPPVVQVPHPAGAGPVSASAETGSSSSVRARM